jgi:hypothetical protein
LVFFGTFTGYLASWFMEPGMQSDESMNITAELGSLRAEIQQLRNEVVAGRPLSPIGAAAHPVPSLPVVPGSDISTFLKPGA